MFEREVSDLDRQSRFGRTANCSCLRIQPVQSSCFGRRKKSVECSGIRAGGLQRSDCLQIAVASPRSYLSRSSAQRQTLRRGTIRPVLTSSHYTRLRRVFAALQDEFAKFPSLCCLFSARLLQCRVTGGEIRDVPVGKSVWNVSRKRTTLIAMALLEAASRCRYSRRRWEGGNARCAHIQYTAGTKGRGCVCGSMVSTL